MINFFVKSSVHEFFGHIRKILEIRYIFVKKEKPKLKKKFQVYQFFYYSDLFVQFLAINRDKSQYNMINSMGAMIFFIY